MVTAWLYSMVEQAATVAAVSLICLEVAEKISESTGNVNHVRE